MNFYISTLSTSQHDTRAAFLFSQRSDRKNPNYTKQKLPEPVLENQFNESPMII